MTMKTSNPVLTVLVIVLLLFNSLFNNSFAASGNCTDSLSVKSSVVWPVKISFAPFMSVNANLDLVVYAADTTTIITHFTKNVQSATDTTIYVGPGLYYLVSLNSWPVEIKPPYITGNYVSSTGSYNLNNSLTTPFRVTPEQVFCEGKYTLEANVSYNGTGTLSYKWSPAEGLNNDTVQRLVTDITNSATYTVTVSSSNGCSASSLVKVDVKSISVDAGNDTSAILGTSLRLNRIKTNYTGSGNLRYKWTPAEGLNNDTIEQPVVTIQKNMNYVVTVTTPTGCSAQDDINISLAPLEKPVIGIVGVSSNNKNRLAWNKPVSGIIDFYSVYKETSVTNVYRKIGMVPYDSLSVFEDTLSVPDVKSGKYTLSVTDKSGLESEQSIPHKSIHLAISKGLNNSWNLIWEPYEGFVAATYNIYRGTSNSNLNFLDAVSASSTQYTDLDAPTGDVYYQVEVISPQLVNPSKIRKIQNENNSLLITYNSSRSNVASNITDGISDTPNVSNLNLYPNPVKDVLFVNSTNVTTLEFTNTVGQTIKYTSRKNNSVDISGLLKGVYLVKINDGINIKYTKIIKL